MYHGKLGNLRSRRRTIWKKKKVRCTPLGSLLAKDDTIRQRSTVCGPAEAFLEQEPGMAREQQSDELQYIDMSYLWTFFLLFKATTTTTACEKLASDDHKPIAYVDHVE